MRKISIFIILFSLIFLCISLFISLTAGKLIFTETINLPEVYSKNIGTPFRLEKGTYHFVFRINVENGRLDSDYAINLKNQSHDVIWSKKGRLYSTKGNRFITEALYSLESFNISHADEYIIYYQIFPSKYTCKINKLSFSLKKDSTAFPPFIINVLTFLLLTGLIVLLLSFKKQH